MDITGRAVGTLQADEGAGRYLLSEPWLHGIAAGIFRYSAHPGIAPVPRAFSSPCDIRLSLSNNYAAGVNAIMCRSTRVQFLNIPDNQIESFTWLELFSFFRV
jgi:hypothetical protein